MTIVRICLLLAISTAGMWHPAVAQDASLVSERGRELVRDPDLFVGRDVTVVQGYCFFDQPNFVCIGQGTPFEVKANAIPAGAIEAAIKENCGDIQGTEHNPTPACAYSFRFVASSFTYGIGDYVVNDRVQSNKKLVYFTARVLEPMRR